MPLKSSNSTPVSPMLDEFYRRQARNVVRSIERTPDDRCATKETQMALAPEDMVAIVGSAIIASFLRSRGVALRGARLEAWLIRQTQRLLLRPDERDAQPAHAESDT
jgi:hypothetical protein